MDVSNRDRGRVVLCLTLLFFLTVIVWVNGYPFIEHDSVIWSWVPEPVYCLVPLAVLGLTLFGGLTLFTLYHLFPYLDIHK